MATNLVSLVMQFLTPEMIGRVATALGLDRNMLQTAVDARARSQGGRERYYRLLTTTFGVRFSSAAQEAQVHPALTHLEIQPARVDAVVAHPRGLGRPPSSGGLAQRGARPDRARTGCGAGLPQ